MMMADHDDSPRVEKEGATSPVAASSAVPKQAAMANQSTLNWRETTAGR